MHLQTLTSVSKQVGKSSASGPNHGYTYSPPLKSLFFVLYYTAPHLTLKQGFLSIRLGGPEGSIDEDFLQDPYQNFNAPPPPPPPAFRPGKKWDSKFAT